MLLSIVLPTYNERENIQRLIPKIERLLRKRKWEAEILVVDDTSPDGTAAVAEELNSRYRNIRVIRRPKKEGIGAALREGYNRARGDLILSLDVDFFNLQNIVRIRKEIMAGADAAIGSRRIAGGRYDANSFRTRLQWFCSSIGNKALHWFFVPEVNDFTVNVRGFRRRVWKRIRTEENGNIFLIEMILKMSKARCRIVQIPVVLTERKFGASKLRFAQQSMRFLMRLCAYFPQYNRFTK